jgi:hypothetical protein
MNRPFAFLCAILIICGQAYPDVPTEQMRFNPGHYDKGDLRITTCAIEDNKTIASPEPATVFLLGLGCLVLPRRRRREQFGIDENRAVSREARGLCFPVNFLLRLLRRRSSKQAQK